MNKTHQSRAHCAAKLVDSLVGTQALVVAAKAQAEVAVLAGTGILAAAYGLLPREHLTAIAKLTLNLLQPALILSLNQNFTWSRLLSWSPVIAVAVLHILLGALLGAGFGRLLRLTSPRRELLVLTTAFGNGGSLPFIFVLPIVSQWVATRDDPSAYETGMATIGLYLFAWMVSFFSAGTWYAKRILIKPNGSLAAQDAAGAATGARSGSSCTRRTPSGGADEKAAQTPSAYGEDAEPRDTPDEELTTIELGAATADAPSIAATANGDSHRAVSMLRSWCVRGARCVWRTGASRRSTALKSRSWGSWAKRTQPSSRLWHQARAGCSVPKRRSAKLETWASRLVCWGGGVRWWEGEREEVR